MKQRYYRLKKILECNADYMVLLGERSNGKSYAVKEECVTRAYNAPDTSRFVLLRRWQLEIKGGLIEQYFADCPIKSITNGEYETVSYWQGKLFLANYTEEGKVARGICIGYVRGLTAEEHYKSGSYIDCDAIIYEEFTSKNGYLPHEPTTLMSFISTVARRRKIRVFLIGNTVSRICPYFSEWQLTGLMKQKQGTIDIYNINTENYDEHEKQVVVRVAVEFCENSGKNTLMSFGQASKMISTGAWECDTHPHLTKRLECYNLVHIVVFAYQSNKFLVRFLSDNDGNCFCYVEPKTSQNNKKYDRTVSDTFEVDNLHTVGFVPLSQKENILFNLIKNKKVCFSDNLTGSEFWQCYNAL